MAVSRQQHWVCQSDTAGGRGDLQARITGHTLDRTTSWQECEHLTSTELSGQSYNLNLVVSLQHELRSAVFISCPHVTDPHPPDLYSERNAVSQEFAEFITELLSQRSVISTFGSKET